MTPAMLALLAKAAKSPDGSVRARGHGHAVDGVRGTMASALALVRRGFLVELHSNIASIFRITADGRAVLKLEGFAFETRNISARKA